MPGVACGYLTKKSEPALENWNGPRQRLRLNGIASLTL
jgi:hypothetical protein